MGGHGVGLGLGASAYLLPNKGAGLQKLMQDPLVHEGALMPLYQAVAAAAHAESMPEAPNQSQSIQEKSQLTGSPDANSDQEDGDEGNSNWTILALSLLVAAAVTILGVVAYFLLS